MDDLRNPAYDGEMGVFADYGEFEIDFIACSYMLSDHLSYEEARKKAVEEWKEMRSIAR